MPTMIQKFQCGACSLLYDTDPEADLCYFSDTAPDVMSRPGSGSPSVVTIVNRYQCDGPNCEQDYPDQFAAQACETGHEEAKTTGRPDGTATDGHLFGQWMKRLTS